MRLAKDGRPIASGGSGTFGLKGPAVGYLSDRHMPARAVILCMAALPGRKQKAVSGESNKLCKNLASDADRRPHPSLLVPNARFARLIVRQSTVSCP